MSKRVKISLISTIIFSVILFLINKFIPFLDNQQRTVDTIIVTFISSIIYYFVTYYLIRGLEKKDEKKEEK